MQSVQHVSGDNFAYPQEHCTGFTACGIMHRRCCQLATAVVSWQHRRCIIPQAVNTG